MNKVFVVEVSYYNSGEEKENCVYYLRSKKDVDLLIESLHLGDRDHFCMEEVTVHSFEEFKVARAQEALDFMVKENHIDLAILKRVVDAAFNVKQEGPNGLRP